MNRVENKDKLTPRELLWHIKRKIKKDNYKEYDKRCQENIYDVIKKDTEYFCKTLNSNLSEIIYVISVFSLIRSKPSEVYEFCKRFNKSATGIYGLEYDNQTGIMVSDRSGRKFRLFVWKPYNKYEFEFCSINGGTIYQFYECKDEFSQEHLDGINNLYEYEKKYNEEIENKKIRRAEIEKNKNFISIKTISNGYAHCIKRVKVLKSIPIQMTEQEIAEYADDFNFCFGGKIRKDYEDEKEIVYTVRINTD